jgi:DNA-binding transcriptional regulator YhcF (GntR family)
MAFKIGALTHKLRVSYPTLRKVVKDFEQKGILENYGSLGFFVSSARSILLKKQSTMGYFTSQLRKNLDASIMLSQGAHQYGQWIVHKNKEQYNLINITTGQKISTTLGEIQDIDTEMSLEKLLKIKSNNVFNIERERYKRMLELLPVVKILTKEIHNER